MGVMVRVVIAVVAASLELALGAVYKVGDKAGWTTIGNVDYKQWSALKTFHLGDVIRFEYNAEFHNVMQVRHGEYKGCNTTSPKATYSSGNDSITITNRGHHFFLCGVPGHCQAGQKVDINVPRLHTAPALSPAPPPASIGGLGGVSAPSPNQAQPKSPQIGRLLLAMQGVALAFALYFTYI